MQDSKQKVGRTRPNFLARLARMSPHQAPMAMASMAHSTQVLGVTPDARSRQELKSPWVHRQSVKILPRRTRKHKRENEQDGDVKEMVHVRPDPVLALKRVWML